MAVVQTGAWWQQQADLMREVSDLYLRGAITDDVARDLYAAITKGSYHAAVDHLVAEGVIPKPQ